MIEFLVKVYMTSSSAYVLFLILNAVVRCVIRFILRRRLNVGSETYLKVKDNLESCIKSGEINDYYNGFQFVKIDKSKDSSEMMELQSTAVPLTRFERYKLIVFGKSLLNQH